MINFNHSTNDISASSGIITINGAAVSGGVASAATSAAIGGIKVDNITTKLDTNNFLVIPKVIRLKFLGSLIPQYGADRWYPESNVTIRSAYLTFGTAGTGNTAVSINMNGVQLFTITSGANANISTKTTGLSYAVSTSDYLTADITTSSGGKNLTIYLIYE